MTHQLSAGDLACLRIEPRARTPAFAENSTIIDPSSNGCCPQLIPYPENPKGARSFVNCLDVPVDVPIVMSPTAVLAKINGLQDYRTQRCQKERQQA